MSNRSSSKPAGPSWKSPSTGPRPTPSTPPPAASWVMSSPPFATTRSCAAPSSRRRGKSSSAPAGTSRRPPPARPRIPTTASAASAGLQQLPGLDKPVIAAVNGLAFGGGFEIALSADLILAAEHATFALPEINSGTLADAATIKLPRRMPYHVAMELLFTGRVMDAAEARRWGIVNEVLPADRLMTAPASLPITWPRARRSSSPPSSRWCARPRICRSSRPSTWSPGARSAPSTCSIPAKISWKAPAPSPKSANPCGKGGKSTAPRRHDTNSGTRPTKWRKSTTISVAIRLHRTIVGLSDRHAVLWHSLTARGFVRLLLLDVERHEVFLHSEPTSSKDNRTQAPCQGRQAQDLLAAAAAAIIRRQTDRKEVPCTSCRPKGCIISPWSAPTARHRSISGRACSACRSCSSSPTSTSRKAICISTPATGG
jgi:hypothetical protein